MWKPGRIYVTRPVLLNKALRGQAHDQTHAITKLAKSFLDDFKLSTWASSPHARSNQSSAITTWSPPEPGRLKLNVDAAIPKGRAKVGFGSVIRNNEGLVVAAVAFPYTGAENVATLEAKSLLLALRWCIEKHFPVHVVETDCKAITDALDHPKEDISYFGDLISQIKEALSHLPVAHISHVNRSANTFADKLTHWALGLDEVAIWNGDDPCNLRDFLSL
uniref:RNase H type-1 domain-containing protein n=1 Tax=Cannabis sativa TaxID=3483 RepID=A0A803P130_CANSA